jgi:hypothetical protein
MFIYSNGDVCDDEEIYGESIHEYPEFEEQEPELENETDVSDDEDCYLGQFDERVETIICGWEYKYRKM